MTIPNLQSFVKECAIQGLFLGINPHYLAAVAFARSGVKDDTAGSRIGPYRVTQQFWDANDFAEELAIVLLPADIASWRSQCEFAALTAFRAQNRLIDTLGRMPSVSELYAEQWPDDPAPTTADLQAALDATAQLVGPAIEAELDEPLPAPVTIATPDTPTGFEAPDPVGPTVGPDERIFVMKAPLIMERLMNEFALQDYQAAGILGNLGYESGGLRVFQEKLKPGSKGRGGLGWAQWTATRRVNFETFCQTNGFDTSSDEGNFGFLRQELQEPKGEKRKSIAEVKKAATQRDAVRLFEADFERAGLTVKRYEQRDRWAKLALDAFKAPQGNRLPAAAARLLDPDLGYSIVASAKSGPSTFWIVVQNAEHGGEVLIEETDGAVQILKQDTTVFPLPRNLPAAVAAAFASQFVAGGNPQTDISPTPATSIGKVADLIRAMAQTCDGTLITRNVPNTKSGTLACAWAINEVVRRALGKPVDPGLYSTIDLAGALEARHTRLDEAGLIAGAIVISPTRGHDIGHAGIVGAIQTPIGNTRIYSNSSSKRVFFHYYTLDRWHQYFTTGQKHLDVLFYAV